MARRRSTPPRQLHHHWFLPEWAEALGKKQADATRELGWNKATASFLWTGKQRYTQDLVEEVADWLNIRPYELLMAPDQAMAIRRLREDAIRIAADHSADDRAPRAIPTAEPQAPPAAPKKTGTNG